MLENHVNIIKIRTCHLSNIISLMRWAVMVLFILPLPLGSHVAYAQSLPQNQDPRPPIDAPPIDAQIRERVEQSLFNHPELQSGRARICQSLNRLGLRRAESRPQISSSVNSRRKLLSHVRAKNNPERFEADDPTPAHDRTRLRLTSEEDLNVYDVEVTVRHKLWDWHVSDNRINAEQFSYEAEKLRFGLLLSEQLLQLISVSARLDLAEQIVALNKQALIDMEPYIEAIEAQGEAGLIRLADVRRARLLQLDADIALREAENNYQQAVEQLKTQFQFMPREALRLYAHFLLTRPEGLFVKPVQSLHAVQVIELQLRQSVYEMEAIGAEKLPVLDLNINGTLFDISDYESEYEVIGQMQMSMPLYDGGTNKARLAESSWRIRELGQDKRRQLQDTENEMIDIQNQFDETRRLLIDLASRQESVDKRLDSLIALSGSADVQRMTIAEAVMDRRSTVERYLTNQANLEILRANNMHITDELVNALNLFVGERGC